MAFRHLNLLDPPFLARVNQPPVPPFLESFEFSGGWPGTYDADYWRTYTGFATPSAAFSESFENAGGWPGT